MSIALRRVEEHCLPLESARAQLRHIGPVSDVARLPEKEGFTDERLPGYR
jgi:hypothetical protein